MSANDIVLCSALRSPIGRFLGTLSAVRPDDLLARLFGAASGPLPKEICSLLYRSLM